MAHDVQLSPTFDSDGDNTAQSLKASPAKLYKVHAYNSNTADAFIQLFNAASGDVTVGTTTPDYVLLVPGEGGVTEDFPVDGLFFSTALTYACTTTPTGNGDPTTGLTVSFAAK